jgi:hypothetical protein
MSCKTTGLLVTMPVPPGKNDHPTRLSIAELFPEKYIFSNLSKKLSAMKIIQL